MFGKKSNDPKDFSGFLDGYHARNMATIERTTALQLSEMQTRLRLLRATAEATATAKEMQPLLLLAENTFKDSSRSIVKRLVSLGQFLGQLIVEHSRVVVREPQINEQIKGIVRRYVEAAESSHHDKLLDSAVLLAETYTNAASRYSGSG